MWRESGPISVRLRIESLARARNEQRRRVLLLGVSEPRKYFTQTITRGSTIHSRLTVQAILLAILLAWHEPRSYTVAIAGATCRLCRQIVATAQIQSAPRHPGVLEC